MQENEESLNKGTERGRELYIYYHKLLDRYRDFQEDGFGLGREVENWLESLSDDDFGELMYQPIGNITRTHLTHLRERTHKDNILIHIPHASNEFPNMFWDMIIVDKKYIKDESVFLSDYLVDLFVPYKAHNIVKAKYSRMYCDVERYRDDIKETMTKYNMGAIYEKDSNGIRFIQYDMDYKEKVLNCYYDEYHKELTDKASKILKYNKSCIILDLHSFSNEYVKKIFEKNTDVDICLGTTKEAYKESLVSFSKAFFEREGYKVAINNPFNGAIIPNEIDLSKNTIYSLMVEINKDLYLDNNKILNKEKYVKLKKAFDEYFLEVQKRFKSTK